MYDERLVIKNTDPQLLALTGKARQAYVDALIGDEWRELSRAYPAQKPCSPGWRGDRFVFGALRGVYHLLLQYGEEPWEKYCGLHNRLPKEKLLAHMEKANYGLLCGEGLCRSREMFTGDVLVAGMVCDGPFAYPLEFVHYYRTYDIGIPCEYEAWLAEQAGL